MLDDITIIERPGPKNWSAQESTKKKPAKMTAMTATPSKLSAKTCRAHPTTSKTANPKMNGRRLPSDDVQLSLALPIKGCKKMPIMGLVRKTSEAMAFDTPWLSKKGMMVASPMPQTKPTANEMRELNQSFFLLRVGCSRSFKEENECVPEAEWWLWLLDSSM